MERYIDVNKLIKDLAPLVYNKKGHINNDHDFRIMTIVGGSKTEDVRPVVRGEWIKVAEREPNIVNGIVLGTKETIKNKCAKCGCENSSAYQNFCPNCGSDNRKILIQK